MGNLTAGHGLVTTGSTALLEAKFSFDDRVGEGDGPRTNPEELIAAAIASCFSMALSKTIQDDGIIPQQLVVNAAVTATLGEGGIKISGLTLDVTGMVGGYTESQFVQAVETTRKNCPVYQVFEPGFGGIDVTCTLRN